MEDIPSYNVLALLLLTQPRGLLSIFAARAPQAQLAVHQTPSSFSTELLPSLQYLGGIVPEEFAFSSEVIMVN